MQYSFFSYFLVYSGKSYEQEVKAKVDNPQYLDPAPRIVVVRSKPKRSRIFRVLWDFAAERHSIYLMRVAGKRGPWTKNPILGQYKFTNAYRVADRVSQYLISMTYKSPVDDVRTIFLRTLLFKIFNRIDTWEDIVELVGVPVAGEFNFDTCEAVLQQIKTAGRSIYSGAYIMPSVGTAGASKHRMHLTLLRHMLEGHFPER